MLDQHFFERIKRTDHETSIFESYKAVYARSTMVLFSRQTRTPLAALTLKADDVGCLSMLTGRPAPVGETDPYFQGMLNMPDQTFTFTISNLSDQGMINFNILHTPHRVSAVNPGPSYGINEVNELHQNESYTIPADQRNDRRMILTGKTTTIKDPETSMDKQVAVTVKQSEANPDKPTGLYFYLNVVPDVSCKSLVDKFAEGTVWRVATGFVRRTRCVASLGLEGPTRPMARSLLPQDAFGCEFVGFAPPMFGSPRTRIPEHVFPGAFLESALDIYGDEEDERTIQSRTEPPIPPTLSAELVNAEEEERHRQYNINLALQKGGVDNEEGYDEDELTIESRTGIKKALFVAPVDVGTTQAGALTYGQQVDVHSGCTGHEYAYEHGSEPTVLCMSIWEGMKFLALSNTVEEELAAEVKEWVENEGKALIASLNAIFKVETCVIDLESEADTIVCTCGHQCLNHANVGNLRKCPMCRSPITAFVRADGIIMA